MGHSVGAPFVRVEGLAGCCEGLFYPSLSFPMIDPEREWRRPVYYKSPQSPGGGVAAGVKEASPSGSLLMFGHWSQTDLSSCLLFTRHSLYDLHQVISPL